MSDLFRREAVAHKTQRFHGAILLTRTWSFAALTIFFACIVLAQIAFSLVFGFTRKESVNGIVVASRGLIRIVAPQTAVVRQVLVSEGQAVKAGDLLFVLSSERTSDQGDTQRAVGATQLARIDHLHGELDQRARQLANSQDELADKYVNLKASLVLLEKEAALLGARVRIARDLAANFAELAETGAVSGNAAQEKRASLIEQESRLAANGLQRMDLQRQLAALAAAQIDLPLTASRDSSLLKRGIEELKGEMSETAARRQLMIRADHAGRVAGIVVAPGQAIAADARIADLLPADGKLEAELYAPSRSVGFVQEGMEVLLRYDAYPYQKFGQFRGKVREISLNTIPMSDMQRNGSAMQSVDPVYRIRVALDAQDVIAAGRTHALRPGMQLSASLVLERRTLAEWVVAPLAGVAGAQ
jgi:membrane fusion protein